MKKILISLLILLALAAATAYFFYQKPTDSLADLKAEFKLDAISLVSAFNQDETSANTKYLNKIIEVEGVLAEVKIDSSYTTLILDGNDIMTAVMCEMDPSEIIKTNIPSIGSRITIRGQCSGMLADVVLSRCIILH